MESQRHSDSSDENSESSLESFLTGIRRMNDLPSSATERRNGAVQETNEEYARMLRELDDSFEELQRTLSSLRIDMNLSSKSLQVPELTGRRGFASDLQRDQSDSPHTDQDFDDSSYASSSSSHSQSTSWILGNGMISRTMADSMISGDGNGEREMEDSFYEGSFHDAIEVWSERETGGPDILINCPANFIHAVDISDGKSETSESSDDSGSSGIGIDDIYTDRVRDDQIKLAAAVTLAVLALVCAFEHQ